MQTEGKAYTIVNGEMEVGDCEIWDVENSGVAMCFSGGKDSLLLLGLYQKFDGQYPLPIITESPLPPMTDHNSQHRKSLLKKLDVLGFNGMAVKSNLREIYVNNYPLQTGTIWYLNEILDCILYITACLPIVKQFKRRGVAIASEFDVQRVRLVQDVYIADEYFMYHIHFLESLSQMLSMLHGVKIENLISSLPHYCIQYLLVHDFPQLLALQDSCYQKTTNMRWCSHCIKCFSTALLLLSFNYDPRKIGIDLMKVFWPKASYWNLEGDRRFLETWKSIRLCAQLIDLETVEHFLEEKTLLDKLKMKRHRRLNILKLLKKVEFTENERLDSGYPKEAMWQFIPENLKGELENYFRAHFREIDKRRHEEIIKGLIWMKKYIFSK